MSKRLVSLIGAACLLLASQVFAASPLVVLMGTDFKGGAADLYGSVMGGEMHVNYVYARPTGGHSTMQAIFNVAQIPQESLFLHLKGRDDDFPAQCAIRIELNGKALFDGKNDFSRKGWQTDKFAIPADALRVGENTLVVTNTETEGKTGMPPWFQVAQAVIAGDKYVILRDLSKDFWVELPKTMRPFPEPLNAGQAPGFPMRGIKGWMWTPEQYLAEIPVLAKYKLNFLQNCYTSMCDTEHYRWGDPNVNRWWEDLPAPKKAAYEDIVRQCQKNGIQFCFSMNPNLCSKRALDYNSGKDIEDLYKHYAWMQSLGVKWFNVSLDDISNGIDPAGQSRVVNEIYGRLKSKDPEAKMIFCPTIYWGDGTPANDRKYLETVAKVLDKDIYLFWTGDSVVGNITRKAAESYKQISGHRLFLWDNYPVNDGQPTMHLGPITNRDVDLCEAVDGYMANSMCAQNEANRIPVLTCMDYAYNPSAYDPMRSIGQAIMHLTLTSDGRQALAELVDIYPGFILFGKPQTGLNPVREQFNRLLSMPHASYIAGADISYLEDLSARLDKAFPNSYKAEKATLRNDIQFAKDLLSAKKGN